MSTGSLFDVEPKRGSGLKIVLIAGLAFVVLTAGGFGAYVYTKPTGPNPEAVLADAIRDETVILLSQARFAGEESNKQIFGRGR